MESQARRLGAIWRFQRSGFTVRAFSLGRSRLGGTTATLRGDSLYRLFNKNLSGVTAIAASGFFSGPSARPTQSSSILAMRESQFIG